MLMPWARSPGLCQRLPKYPWMKGLIPVSALMLVAKFMAGGEGHEDACV